MKLTKYSVILFAALVMIECAEPIQAQHKLYKNNGRESGRLRRGEQQQNALKEKLKHDVDTRNKFASRPKQRKTKGIAPSLSLDYYHLRGSYSCFVGL